MYVCFVYTSSDIKKIGKNEFFFLVEKTKNRKKMNATNIILRLELPLQNSEWYDNLQYTLFITMILCCVVICFLMSEIHERDIIQASYRSRRSLV